MGGRTREREGEIVRRRPRLRRAFALAALLLIVVGTASAENRPLPWIGGVGYESKFERYAGQLASQVAGRAVKVICNGATDWGQLAAQQRFDPVTVWGYVLFDYDPAGETFHPVNYTQLSEAACWYLDQYWAAPLGSKGKICRVATQIDFRETQVTVQVVKRVKVKGHWTKKVVTVTQTKQVPVEVPQFGVCPDYQNRTFALQAISHESQHLAGIQDEALAECNGIQKLGWFAQQFGATREQGLQMAGDYFRDFYVVKRPGSPYFLPSCPSPAG